MSFITQRSRRVKSLLLAFTLLMQLYLPGVALCLEEDGNASIEDYISGSCADAIPDRNIGIAEHSPLIAGEYPWSGHCGDCLDIPLAERITKKEADSGCGKDQAALMQTFFAYVSPVSLYTVASHQGPFTEGPLKKSTLPGFIKTVILIC
jgi:hypothetical protein